MPNKDNDSDFDNSESLNSESAKERTEEFNIPLDVPGGLETDEGTVDGYYSSPEDKYLANEQPGVTYTEQDNTTLLNSDYVEDGTQENADLWKSDEKNNRNSDAFNQDKYILDDNIDLDEDEFRSISSDDNVEDINTNDG